MRSAAIQPTVLLTLGRLPVALELARAMAGGGWRVLVADPYSWPLCRLSNAVHRCYTVTSPVENADAFQRDLLTIILRENVELVVPVSEESLYVAMLASQLPASANMLCMGAETLCQLHDKYTFARLGTALNLPVPDTFLADSEEAYGYTLQHDFVVKPRSSCAGTGVRITGRGSDLLTEEKSSQFVVQQYLSGEVCSTFSFARKGRALVNLCYRSVLESGSVAVCLERIEMPAQIMRVVEAIIVQTAYTGMIAFDFVMSDKGAWHVIECNPRATSGIHFIDQASLLALISDDRESEVPLYDGMCQEFWSCLAIVEGALFKGKLDRQGWQRLFSTRDITLDRRDLKPFFLMSIVMAPLLVRSLKSGQSMPEILMSDVRWINR